MAMRRVARSSTSTAAAVAAATASPSPSLLFAARPPTESCRRFHYQKIPNTQDAGMSSFAEKMAALGAKMGIGRSRGSGGGGGASSKAARPAALGTGAAAGQTELARAAAALLAAFDFEDAAGGAQLSIDRELEVVLRHLGVQGVADTVRREQVPGRGFGGGFALSQSSLQVLKASDAVESLQALASGEDAAEHVQGFLLAVAQTCAAADPLVSLMCANRALESILGLDEEVAAAAAVEGEREGEGEENATPAAAAAPVAPSDLHDASVVEALPVLTVKTAAYNQLRMHETAEQLGTAVLAGFAREAEEKAAEAAAEASAGGAVVPSGDAKQGFLSSLIGGGGGGGGGTPPVSQRRAHIRWDTVEEVVAEVPRGVAAFFEVADEGAAAATAGPRSDSPRRRHHVGLRSGEMWVVVRLATLQDARRWQDIHRLFASAPTVAGSGGGAEAIAPAVATADSSSPPSSPSPKHLPPSFSSAAATPPSARVSLRSVSPPAAAAAAATAVSGTPPDPLAAVLPLVTQYKTLLKAKLLRAENLEDLFAAESVAFPNLHGGSGGGAGGGAREEGEEGGLRFFPTCRDAVLDRLNRSRFEEAARTISTLRLRCAALEEEKDGLRRRLASAEAAAAAAGGGGGAVAALQETLASERRQHAAAEQAWGVERRSFECKLSGSEAERGAVAAAAAAAATSPLPSPRGLSARASSAS
eukprot:Rhum_TRINITY_DN14382_c26_g1::Rhum_TRINITY_DN14382_c26_g1_i1::g.85409::m.85409